MIIYYLRNGSKLFIIIIRFLFTYLKFSFLKILLCFIPFSFDYIHKERHKEINISSNIFSMYNGEFSKKKSNSSQNKLPKMSNLDYVTTFFIMQFVISNRLQCVSNLPSSTSKAYI